MATLDAFIAANRFGLGARPGELAEIGRDPRGWIGAQIAAPADAPATLENVPSSAAILVKVGAMRSQESKDTKRMARKALRQIAVRLMLMRTRQQVLSARPFRDRMVNFWLNHFTVSAIKFPIGPLAIPYQREAIEPHVFGRFEDMLLAVVRHPAMLRYLDNLASVGPNSRVGKRRERGLNENLAREILELHTLGVNGGYSQGDVTSFAKMLTGWSSRRPGKLARRSGTLPIDAFKFRPALHEPGAKTLLGKSYAESGEDEAIAALKDLARHPATATFIARKLARHFVADDPPQASIDRLARIFLDSGGDLARVCAALIDDGAVWAEALAKVKAPYELVVSAMRATAYDRPPGRQLLRSFAVLGQSPWHARSPQGWPDRAEDWLSPEALMRRIEWSRSFAARAAGTRSPQAIVDDTIGPVIAPLTQEAIDAQPSEEEAVALILASREFQRR